MTTGTYRQWVVPRHGGPEVFEVGQTVASLPMRGGYAESALCPAYHTAVVPD
ncbi:MAG: hypothetical protein HYR62_06895 [Actinobacteria bacterium]|nr:hypothetical protein [Actinomycetota bacterium]MBI3688311.1 hypothetical protein [Actinomycetota bacterium]